MAWPRAAVLVAASDLKQAWRRALLLGPARLTATVAAAIALAAAEAWIAHRLAVRLLAVPAVLLPLAEGVLLRAASLVGELTMMVATASAVTLALPALEGVAADPWWASCPIPSALRALQAWWRVLAGLGWVVVLAAPPLLTIGFHLDPALTSLFGQATALLLLMAVAAALGVAIALVLAALIPRRVLLPLSWSVTTLAAVGAVLWLRHLHPERLAAATEPEQLVAALTALTTQPMPGGLATWVAGALPGTGPPLGLAGAAVVALALLALLWAPLARPAALRISAEAPGHARPWRAWRLLDSALARRPLGVLVLSRLRLLVRDLTQASQTLYLLGLGAVYVENLRSLPLADPLARELAGLINLGMAGLLAAAMALRFAYPAHLLEGESHWWWSSGPVARGTPLTAAFAVAALPPLALSGCLFTASLAVTGPSHAAAVGWWLVPWQALWLSALGVALGPRAPDPRHGSWVDAALGGGGILFLAMAVAGVGWTALGAGRRVIADVLHELEVDWDPGLWFGHPSLAALILSGLTAVLVLRRRRSA